MTVCGATIDSPVGPLFITVDEDGSLTRCETLRGRSGSHLDEVIPNDPRCEAAASELRAYFDGTLTRFTVALRPCGTEFQRRVWKELEKIPYGTTISYLELARRVGNPKAVRAVGGANGANPIAIVLPCHRVIGADGSLTGYGGGLDMKRQLLAMERGYLRSASAIIRDAEPLAPSC